MKDILGGLLSIELYVTRIMLQHSSGGVSMRSLDQDFP